MPPVLTDASANTRIAAIAAQCVMCGLCLPHCPSYAVTRNEADSPRGRLALMANIVAGTTEPSHHPSLDRCLACGRCERVCPPQVRFVEALVLTRQRHHPVHEHWSSRVARWMAHAGRPRKQLAHLAIRTRRWLPGGLRRRLNLDGVAATEDRTDVDSTAATTATTLLAGCTAAVLEGRAVAAVATVARTCGHALDIDREHCCGALDQHLGCTAERSLPVLSSVTSAVAINSGCLSQWQDALGATSVAGINAWLDALCATHSNRLVEKTQRVALHLPCTQQGQPKEVAAIRRLVARLPGVSLLEFPAQPGCCGAAGTYFLNQPEIAQSLANTLSAQARAMRPDVILSANGACRAQLAQALFDAGADIRVLHPAELLAEYLDEPTR